MVASIEVTAQGVLLVEISLEFAGFGFCSRTSSACISVTRVPTAVHQVILLLLQRNIGAGGNLQVGVLNNAPFLSLRLQSVQSRALHIAGTPRLVSFAKNGFGGFGDFRVCRLELLFLQQLSDERGIGFVIFPRNSVLTASYLVRR